MQWTQFTSSSSQFYTNSTATMDREALVNLIAATFTPTVCDRKKVLLDKWKEAWNAASKTKCPFKVEVEVESRAKTTMTSTRSTSKGPQTIVSHFVNDVTYAQCDQAVKDMVDQVRGMMISEPPRKRAKRTKS